jgi:hypothetical protein
VTDSGRIAALERFAATRATRRRPRRWPTLLQKIWRAMG